MCTYRYKMKIDDISRWQTHWQKNIICTKKNWVRKHFREKIHFFL